MAEAEAYEGEVEVVSNTTTGGSKEVGDLTSRVVRYPGAQQLILWVPQHGYGYGDLTLTGPNGAVIETGPLRSRLNGSVQILTDTLPWAPGDYRLEITHPDGFRHELMLHKHEGDAPKPPPPPPPEPEVDAEPRVYRDGLGQPIPNVDLEIRAKVHADLARRFGRRVTFTGNVRSGTVIYEDGTYRIEFWNEMLGGGFHVGIDIPPAEHWEARTGAPLSLRDEIITFVADETIRQQASTWQYRITATSIDFY